jgi:addiction module RelB/DinJ family antitoxin
MAKTSLLQVRIDTELKREAEKLFAEIGLDTPSAVRLFFKQSVARKAIPFPLTSTNERNKSEFEKTLKGKKSWDVPDSYLNNPLHGGDSFRIFSKEELHER